MDIVSDFKAMRKAPPRGAISAKILARKSGAPVKTCRDFLNRKNLSSGIFVVDHVRQRFYWNPRTPSAK